MSRAPIPVVLVAGFLGSGKTTLLNHLLRNASGTRIGVLVNDFGAINIDAMLIAGQADGTVSLSNGCMCCSVDADGVQAALDQLVRPAAAIDAIVIEASGIAEPRALVRMITGIADARLRYGGLVYVVDAAGFEQTRERHPEIDRHLEIADLVVLNKVDLVDTAHLERIRARIVERNDTAPMVATTDSVVDSEMLFDHPERPGSAAPRSGQLTLDELFAECGTSTDADRHEHDHHHLHDQYRTIAYATERPMDPRRLAGFLERPPAGCYRIKGVVAFDVPGHRQKFMVHAVGGFIRVQRGPWGDQSPSTSIVAIGVGLDDVEVRDRLDAAVDQGVDDEHGILSITRYLITAP
ncbi:CobW family GTP-binding protein [Gordonia sp. CPCC 205515]|uniref:CobW family GTP-binding protein n=1 Tax=Gordonia sp. CPCC 205515 TaxID=3140791 RepID=UPI003AF38C60